MQRDTLNPTDTLTRFARRSLWLALILVLFLGVCALLAIAFPQSSAARYTGKLMALLPLAIVFAVVWVRSSLQGKSANAASESMRAVLNDELRQSSMQKAFRAAFWGTLLCQPVMGFAFVWMPLPSAPQIMATVTVLVGTCVFLGTFLLYDRQ